MIDDPLPQSITFDELWMYDPAEKFLLFEEELDDDTKCFLHEQFGSEAWRFRNVEIWKQCKAAGLRVVDIHGYFGGNEGHLGRILKDGTAPDWDYGLALEMAGLSQVLLNVPQPHQRVFGRARAVEALKHRKSTSQNRLGDAARQEASLHSLPHAALMQAIIGDDAVAEKWFHLAVPVANDFRGIDGPPELIQLLDSVYGTAVQLIATDPDAVAILKSWSPSAASVEVALGRIAQAWNPYQSFWYLAEDGLKV